MSEEGIRSLVPGNLEVSVNERSSATIELKLTHGVDQAKLRRAVSWMIEAFGVDRKEQNFRDTPRRVTKMWAEWLQPQKLELTTFETKSGGMVVLRGHPSATVCPHHLLPVELKVDVGYIPSGYAVGLSKLARVLDLVASSFVLQEHISTLTVDLLDTLLQPKGVICRVTGKHGCMRTRGVRTSGDVVTVDVSGIFHSDEKARMEFYESVGK